MYFRLMLNIKFWIYIFSLIYVQFVEKIDQSRFFGVKVPQPQIPWIICMPVGHRFPTCFWLIIVGFSWAANSTRGLKFRPGSGLFYTHTCRSIAIAIAIVFIYRYTAIVIEFSTGQSLSHFLIKPVAFP